MYVDCRTTYYENNPDNKQLLGTGYQKSFAVVNQ